MDLPQIHLRVPKEFPMEVWGEVDSMQLAPELFEGKNEVSALTIDGPQSLDLDDAISLEKLPDGYRIQVSIADVAALVKPGSAVNREALARIYTRYLPTKNVPMIPRDLSEDRLSLLPGQPRPTVTISVDIGDDLSVRNTDVRKTFLRSRRKMHYAEADRTIADAADADHPLLAEANVLAQRLMTRRRLQGAFLIYDLKAGLATTEEGQIVAMNEDQRHRSHIVIQEFMIVANKAVTQYMIEHGIPCLFRNHTVAAHAPSREEMTELYNTSLLDPAHIDRIREQIRLTFNRARYSPRLQGHFALNEPAYMHFTSPIRRLADLITHQNLDAHLRSQPLPYAMADLERLAEHINTAHDAIEKQTKQRYMAIAQRNQLRTDTDMQGAVLRTMKAGDFENVMRTAALQGEMPSALLDEIARRLQSGELRALQGLCLVLAAAPAGTPAWATVRTIALAQLQLNPHDAVSILSMAPQQLPAWDDTAIHDEANQLGWSAWVEVRLDSRLFRTPHRTEDRNRKTARQLAARVFWDCYAKGTLLQSETVGPSEAHLPTAIAAVLAEPVIAAQGEQAVVPGQESINGNPVGELQELCCTRGYSPPEYTFSHSGPSHDRTYTALVLVRAENREFTSDLASATRAEGSRTTAKKKAAANVLSKIRAAFIEPAQTHDADTECSTTDVLTIPPGLEELLKDDPVSTLQNICNRQAWGNPQYQYQRRGILHSPIFACTISVTIDGETKTADLGVGRSKAEAKKVAAAQFLLRMKHDMPLLEAAPEETDVPADNAVGKLLELCQQQTWKLPSFAFGKAETGFTCEAKITVQGTAYTANGSGRHKQTAKQAAADALLKEIESKGLVSTEGPADVIERIAAPLGGDAVMLLHNFCQHYHFTKPTYQEHWQGEVVCVTARVCAGTQEFTGQSEIFPDKKEARQAAAEAVFVNMKRERPDLFEKNENGALDAHVT